MMPNNFISVHSQFLHLKPDESRKNIWKDLALNPSLHTPLATTSTTRPCLIGLEEEETEDGTEVLTSGQCYKNTTTYVRF